MSENSTPFKFTYKMQKLVTALLMTRTEGEAATMAGVSPRTVARWLNKPEFRAELKAAAQEAGKRRIDETMHRLTEGQRAALDTLEAVMKGGNNTEKRQAAVSWLNIFRDLRDVVEFDERLTALEDTMGKGSPNC